MNEIELEDIDQTENTFVINEYNLKKIKIRNIIMKLLDIAGGEINFDDHTLIAEYISYMDMDLGETLAAVVRNRGICNEKNN